MELRAELYAAWIPVAAIVILLGATLLSRGPRRLLVALLTAAAAAVTFTVQYVETERWGWLLAAIPAVLLVQHAVSLAFFRSRYISSDPSEAREPVVDQRHYHVLLSAWDANQRYFSPDALVLRFWIPGIFVAFIGVTLVYKLFSPLFMLDVPHAPAVIPAARLGAAGAYVYVLLTLGQRAMRNDISSGTAIWCAVTLALGPILAAVLALIWKASEGADGSGFLSAAAYFMAGFAPRFMANAIQDRVRKVWTSSDSQPVATNTVPLTQLRGIDQEIALRLSEEGVVDANGMAMADPHKLLRNTGFDKRQILAWIDEALLAYYLPDTWKVLEGCGITGAIDLAVLGADRHSPATQAFIAELAAKTKLTAPIVEQLIARLYEDAQVQLVWVLYQLGTAEIPLTNPAVVPVQGEP